MAYGQTLLVLLAIVLFSTMMLGYYNNVSRWFDLNNREFARFQALKIADGVFQEIEYKYVTDLISFNQLSTTWQDSTRVLNYGDFTYNINIETNWCDSVGVDTSPGSSFLRVDLRISCSSAFMDSVFVGTQNDPLQKMIADMEL